MDLFWPCCFLILAIDNYRASTRRSRFAEAHPVAEFMATAFLKATSIICVTASVYGFKSAGLF